MLTPTAEISGTSARLAAFVAALCALATPARAAGQTCMDVTGGSEARYIASCNPDDPDDNCFKCSAYCTSGKVNDAGDGCVPSCDERDYELNQTSNLCVHSRGSSPRTPNLLPTPAGNFTPGDAYNFHNPTTFETGFPLSSLVVDVYCGGRACAARRSDGTAVAWGAGDAWVGGSNKGGDASGVTLTDVVNISCGGEACVARKSDGTAVAWGDSEKGGDIRCTEASCTPLPSDINLTDIADISCGVQACVARKNDGTAYAWGASNFGGDASGKNLTNVADISCGWGACVARKNDGTAVAWGHAFNGGDASSVDLINVVDISCGYYACVARKSNGQAVVWGAENLGGSISCTGASCEPLPNAANGLTNVADISCGGYACVVRKNDGTAYAWGKSNSGGDTNGVDLTNVADISCSPMGVVCVARKNDGTAYAWGDSDYGGDTTGVDLTNVADISCGHEGCVARRNDDTAVSWGYELSKDLTDVADFSCGKDACVARKNDGSAVVWGYTNSGGRQPQLNNVCANQPCTVTDCCTVIPTGAKTCGDIDGSDSAATESFNCDSFANNIHAAPSTVMCTSETDSRVAAPCNAATCCTVTTATKNCSSVASQGTNGTNVCGGGYLYDVTKADATCASSPCVAGGSDVDTCCKLAPGDSGSTPSSSPENASPSPSSMAPAPGDRGNTPSSYPYVLIENSGSKPALMSATVATILVLAVALM